MKTNIIDKICRIISVAFIVLFNIGLFFISPSIAKVVLCLGYGIMMGINILGLLIFKIKGSKEERRHRLLDMLTGSVLFVVVYCFI